MMRRLKADLGTTILFNTGSVEQHRLIADHVCYLCEGCIVESGPVAEVLDSPQSESAAKYIADYKASSTDLADAFKTLSKDKALAGHWLPS